MKKSPTFCKTALTLVLIFALLLCGCGGSGNNNTETEALGKVENTSSSETGNTAEPATNGIAENTTGSVEGENTTSAGNKEPSNQDPLAPISYTGPHFTKEEYPIVDGSTATLPLSYALYAASVGCSMEEAMAEVVHSKTSLAYYMMLDDYADLLLVYEPSAAVLEAEKEAKKNLIMEPIGKDALVFMKNEANPVTSLTTDQLRDIYSGIITNWNQVGGENKEIQAFQRPEDTGSQNLMEKFVMQDTPMAEAPTDYVISGMGEILERVMEYQDTADALGYSVYYYAKNMYELPGLSFLAVDGVMPEEETIRTDAYPYVNPFYAVIRESEAADSPARQLFDWLQTPDGQAFVAQVGYVPAQQP